MTYPQFIKLSLLLFLAAICSCQQQSKRMDADTSGLNQKGAGVIQFDGYGPLKDRPINVWYYTPSDKPAELPILFVCHGMNRNADDYRDNWISLADQYKVIIIAPEFPDADYPGSRAYNLGNMFDPEGNRLPEMLWSFSVIDPIFDFVVDQIGGNQTSYDMFGHSAGAQFAHRFIMFKKDTKVDRVVTANAGWYTMPDFSVDYPYGLKETSLDMASLTPMLERKVVVLLGDKDTTRTKSLRQTPEADKQGKNRYERGQAYFEMARQLSDEYGVDLGWVQQTVPGVGHDNAEMAPAAARFLYGND